MSETIGYEDVKCQVGLPGCEKVNAGYHRYKQFAKVGPPVDSCESCAKKSYEQPPQFKEAKEEVCA